jgi:3-dehydroquinate dehydratase-2
LGCPVSTLGRQGNPRSAGQAGINESISPWSCEHRARIARQDAPIQARLSATDHPPTVEPVSTSRESVAMKLLIVQGAGMNMRGKTQTEIFGTMTLDQYNQHIFQYAKDLDITVEIFHSNTEGDVINRLYEANDQGFDGALVNPAGFSRGYPALTAAISQVTFPVIEVHISNPVRRGPVSDTAQVSLGMVTGFGVLGYYLAMRGLRDR